MMAPTTKKRHSALAGPMPHQVMAGGPPTTSKERYRLSEFVHGSDDILPRGKISDAAWRADPRSRWSRRPSGGNEPNSPCSPGRQQPNWNTPTLIGGSEQQHELRRCRTAGQEHFQGSIANLYVKTQFGGSSFGPGSPASPKLPISPPGLSSMKRASLSDLRGFSDLAQVRRNGSPKLAPMKQRSSFLEIEMAATSASGVFTRQFTADTIATDTSLKKRRQSVNATMVALDNVLADHHNNPSPRPPLPSGVSPRQADIDGMLPSVPRRQSLQGDGQPGGLRRRHSLGSVEAEGPKLHFVEAMRTMVRQASEGAVAQKGKKGEKERCDSGSQGEVSDAAQEKADDEGSQFGSPKDSDGGSDEDKVKFVSKQQRKFGVRDALRRIRNQDTGEMYFSNFEEILCSLQLFGSLEDKELVEFTREMAEYSTFSVTSWDEFMEKHGDWEVKYLRAHFDKFLGTEGKTALAAEDLAKFFRTLSIYNTQENMESIMETAGMKEKEQLSFDDFYDFLLVYRLNQGFTDEEIVDAFNVMEEAKDEEQSMEGNPVIKVTGYAVMSAVLEIDMFGLWAAEHAKKLFSELIVDEEEGGFKAFPHVPLGFGEYLAWARRLREMTTKELWDEFFSTVAQDEDVKMEHDQIQGSMLRLGYSLVQSTIDEFLEEAEVEAPLNFDGFVAFARTCFEADGFCKREAEEFEGVFERHDVHQDGELDAMGVIDMINYLGHNTGADKAQQLIIVVDFNGNGSMDIGEFMRLMRLHREEEMAKMRKVFYEHCQPDEIMLVSRLRDCFMSLHDGSPSLGLMVQVIGDLDHPEEVDWQGYVEACDAYRTRAVERKRVQAGFTDPEAHVILEVFQKHCCAGDTKHASAPKTTLGSLGTANRLDMGAFLRFLDELQVPTSTKKDRTQIYKLIEGSRVSSRASAVPADQIGTDGNHLSYHDVLHFLKLVMRENESIAVSREEAGVEETKFSSAEVEEFRNVFLGSFNKAYQTDDTQTEKKVIGPGWRKVQKAFKNGAFGKKKLRVNFAEIVGAVLHQDSRPEAADIIWSKSVAMDIISLQLLLGSIGVKLSEHSKKILDEKVVAMSQESGRVVNPGLDFADFLRMMRWMLDDDFAGVNAIIKPQPKPPS
eukprot:TRINITY_DN11141_c0_g1_i1.p1 TRINITY_DN11141_c0_g1~~TRINITY_DN11141_c0_g1_i1.p1  ORF type:complete len:1121 (+),score=332.88 TRINITY_DN11141_c0_g1_i1:91-3453(+)